MHGVELGRVHAGGEGAADQAAHAGAGGDVDRDAVLLEPADDADVGDAAGAAAAERDPDGRPRRVAHDLRRAIRRRRRPRLADALHRGGAARAPQGHQDP